MDSQTNKVWLVAEGIRQAEGWRAAGTQGDTDQGSKSWRNHNPGNLRVSELEAANIDGFAVFDTDETGFLAIIAQLEKYAKGENTFVAPTDTIEKAMSVYSGNAMGSLELGDYCQTIEAFAHIARTDLISSLAE